MSTTFQSGIQHRLRATVAKATVTLDTERPLTKVRKAKARRKEGMFTKVRKAKENLATKAKRKVGRIGDQLRQPICCQKG